MRVILLWIWFPLTRFLQWFFKRLPLLRSSASLIAWPRHWWHLRVPRICGYWDPTSGEKFSRNAEMIISKWFSQNAFLGNTPGSWLPCISSSFPHGRFLRALSCDPGAHIISVKMIKILFLWTITFLENILLQWGQGMLLTRLCLASPMWTWRMCELRLALVLNIRTQRWHRL